MTGNSEFIPYNEKKNKKKNTEFKTPTKVSTTESDQTIINKQFWYMPIYNEKGDIEYVPERYK